MKILKNLSAPIISLIAAYFIGPSIFWKLYERFFPPSPGSGFFGFEAVGEALAGVVLAYIFFIAITFTILGDDKKYWWTGILLLPAAWFVVQFDLAHWWFYVLLALAGWLIGLEIRKKLRTV